MDTMLSTVPVIPSGFEERFAPEVLRHYEAMGSKLRNTVTSHSGVTSTFDTFGTEDKPAIVALDDYYAGDWVDDVCGVSSDEEKFETHAMAMAHAIGRKSDDLIIGAMCRAPVSDYGNSKFGMCGDTVLNAFEDLDDNGVPDDGQRFAVVGWKQWSAMLNIPEFAAAEYVGTGALPWKGTQAKRWLGTLWMPHSGLPKTGNIRTCFWYHRRAIGHASGSIVKTDCTWHQDRHSHFVNNVMRQGAVLADETAIVAIPCYEN